MQQSFAARLGMLALVMIISWIGPSRAQEMVLPDRLRFPVLQTMAEPDDYSGLITLVRENPRFVAAIAAEAARLRPQDIGQIAGIVVETQPAQAGQVALALARVQPSSVVVVAQLIAQVAPDRAAEIATQSALTVPRFANQIAQVVTAAALSQDDSQPAARLSSILTALAQAESVLPLATVQAVTRATVEVVSSSAEQARARGDRANDPYDRMLALLTVIIQTVSRETDQPRHLVAQIALREALLSLGDINPLDRAAFADRAVQRLVLDMARDIDLGASGGPRDLARLTEAMTRLLPDAVPYAAMAAGQAVADSLGSTSIGGGTVDAVARVAGLRAQPVTRQLCAVFAARCLSVVQLVHQGLTVALLRGERRLAFAVPGPLAGALIDAAVAANPGGGDTPVRVAAQAAAAIALVDPGAAEFAVRGLIEQTSRDQRAGLDRALRQFLVPVMRDPGGVFSLLDRSS